MVVRNHILYVSAHELIDRVAAGFADSLQETINKGCYRNRKDNLKSWAHTKISGITHIDYSSIPAPTLSKYDLPEPSALASESLAGLVQELPEAKTYYLGRQEVYEYAGELAEIAAWLMFMAGITRKSAAMLGFDSLDALYEAALQIMANKWSKWKCGNLRVLKRKLKPFNKLFKKPLNGNYKPTDLHQALDSLISKHYGNSNSQKLTEEQEALLFQLYTNDEGVKTNYEQVHFIYLQKAREMYEAYKLSNGAHGWSEKCLISLSSVKHFLGRPDIQQAAYEKRHGRQAYRANFSIVTKRRPASMANALWVIDGSPVHRYYFDPEKNKGFARLNAFPVLDAHSWCVLGFYVSWQEDTNAVRGALRAACNLGGYLPHQLQFDNSKAIKSYHAQHTLHALTSKCTPAEVGNARAKIIEPFFKHFNERVLKFRQGFTASPVMASSIQNKPNPERLARMLKDKSFPSVEQAVRELHEDYAIWNHHKFNGNQSPLEKYRASIEQTQDEQLPYTRAVEIEAFYDMPGKLKQVKVEEHGKTRQLNQFFPQEYEYTNRGIDLRIDNHKYNFVIEDPAFNARHIGDRFQVKYDPDEISSLMLYKDQKPFIYQGQHLEAHQPEQFAMALYDREEGEAKRLQDHLHSKKLQEQHANSKYSRYMEITESNGTYTPVITANAFDKEVLNNAKAERMEQLVNGDQYRLSDFDSKSLPRTGETEGAKTKRLNRWGMEEQS